MTRKIFRYLEPTFFAGLLDAPVLLVRVRPQGESYMFNCGQIYHLAKRVLTSVSVLFIPHAHMDHFMGIDTFIRHNHHASKAIDIFGSTGITGKLAGKFSGYDWNMPSLCHILH